MFVFSRHRYYVLNVRDITYDHRSSCLCVPGKYLALYDWQIIYDHRCLCLSLPEFQTVPFCSTYRPRLSFLMLVSFWVKYRVFIVRHMIYNHHCLCLCLQELHTVSLLFDISSMIDHPYFCFSPPEFNSVSLMFDMSSMIIILYVCVFQSSILPYIVCETQLYTTKKNKVLLTFQRYPIITNGFQI